MSRLIILDRDGVINQDSDHFIKTPDEFIPLPGSLEAIAQLCQAGYSVMVATNQSGIARKLFSTATLEAMHNKLQLLLAPLGGKIEQFYYCPHGPDDHCSCRKPKPGMILQIAEDHHSLLANSSLSADDSLPAEGSRPADGSLPADDSLSAEGSSRAEGSLHAEGSLANVFVVGDSLRDLQAGMAAGAKVALVKTGKGLRSLNKISQDNLTEYAQLPVYDDLADFTKQLLTTH